MKNRLWRGLLLTFVLAFFVYFALIFLSDFLAFLAALKRFPWLMLLPVLLLSLTNYFIRYLRWNFLLRELSIKVEARVSAYTFYSGLFMSITPGKMGELLKSFLLRTQAGISLARSAPVVFAERLTDLIAVLVITGLFSLYFPAGRTMLLLTLLLIAFLLLLIFNRRAGDLLVRIAKRFTLTQRFTTSLVRFLEHLRAAARPWPLAAGTFFGIFAWLCECFGLYLILNALGVSPGVGRSLFIYAFATLAGALSMLPGGLVFTEGAMTALLVQSGVPRAEAAFATTIIRVATLWFGALLGLFVALTKKDILLQSLGLWESESEKAALSD